MANFQKFGKSSVGHLAAHYERWKIKDPETGKEEYVKFGNQEIDITRTHLNYNLGPEREIGQVDFIQKRISEVRCLNRDDIKILCSCVVTLPKENEDGEKMEYTDDQIRDFFEEAYKQLRDQHGEENVVSCYVHMDETTPHMHFAFVPVVEDRKRGDLKVSAKEAINQTYLRRFHVELQHSMDERFGEGFFPILNGNTEGGNRTIAQLKAERAAEELGTIQNELGKAEADLADIQKEAKAAAQNLDAAKKDLWNTYAQTEEAKKDLEEVSLEVMKVDADKIQLEFTADVLREDITKLRDERAELAKELPELRQQVSEARDELKTMDAAIKGKMDEGIREFGTEAAYVAEIKKAKEADKKEQRISLLEKFIQLPFIKPLWEKFVLEQARGRDKGKSKNSHEWGS